MHVLVHYMEVLYISYIFPICTHIHVHMYYCELIYCYLIFIFCSIDSVARTVYYKYFHPKEALISNGVLNREINKAAGKFVPGSQADQEGVSMQ